MESIPLLVLSEPLWASLGLSTDAPLRDKIRIKAEIMW